MKSVRTTLKKSQSDNFRLFLDSIGLQKVIIGTYQHIDDRMYMENCICYAYREKSNEEVAILTHISLKYGNIQAAYNKYTLDVLMSNINDPYFNWIP